MPLEAGTFIPELNANNPLGGDPKSEGDDHLRLIKRCTLGSFPAFVGNAGAPKSVSLTEDQINDAALKSEVQTISAQWTHSASVTLANDISLRGTESDATARGLIRLTAADLFQLGNSQIDTESRALASESHLIGGTEVADFVGTQSGSLLIASRTGAMVEAGFRHPVRTTLNVDSDVLQIWEGRAIQITGGTPVISGAVLLAGTSVRFWSTSGTWTLIPGALANFRWLNGDGGLNNIPNGILVQQNGIVELFHATTATAYVFGNGISAI